MLNSINTIQNKESFEKFINNDYIETLTNSGQRIGVAGHSIKYITHNIFEVLDDTNIDPSDAVKYAVAFSYNNNNGYSYYIVNVEEAIEPNVSNPNYKFVHTIYDNKVLSGNSDVVSELVNKIVQMGHIEKIYDDYILHYDNFIITFIFRAKILNVDDTAELFYIQYDTNRNKLLHFIQAKKYDDDYHVLINLNKKDDDSYYIDVHKFKLSSIETFIQNFYNINNTGLNLSKLFSTDDILSTNGEPVNFSILNNEFVSYEKLVSSEYTLDTPSFVQFVVNFNGPLSEEDTYDYYIYHFLNIPVTYQDDAEQSLKFTIKTNDLTEDEKAAINKLKGNLGVDINDIYDFVFYVSTIDIGYEYLLNVYNKYYYADNKNQLFLAVIKQLYHTIYNSYNVVNNTILFVPGTFTFRFICNDIDELNIYYFNNINVRYCNSEEFTNTLLKNNFIVYFDNTNENKLVDYNVTIKYNNEYNNIIHSIDVAKVYTYPYINQIDTWMINDYDSAISSYNNLTSIHKIMVIYVDDVSNIDINYGEFAHLVNHLEDEDEKYFIYNKQTFNINPHYCGFYEGTIECNTLVPTINENNYNFFKNTLLLIISNKNNIINSSDDLNYIDNYTGNYVYSLWTCITNDGESKFEYIKDPVSSTFALDPFGYILDHKTKDTNVLYINANANKVAQTEGNVYGHDYAVLRNKTSKNYSDNYNNNLNFIIEYVNYLNESGNNVAYDSINKYIHKLNNTTISNNLYPKYITRYTTSENNIITYKYVDEIKYYIDKGYNIYIDEYNNVITEEYAKNSSVNESSLVKIEDKIQILEALSTEKSTDKYYNEYLPNTNVPLFDSKELLHVNTNVLNRVNILGLGGSSNNSKWYNGFVGTYFDDETEKSVFAISTSNTNINIGTDTLLDTTEATSFDTFETFRINNFENIELNPNKYIETSHTIVTHQTYDTTNVKSISFMPTGYILDEIIFDNEDEANQNAQNKKIQLVYANVGTGNKMKCVFNALNKIRQNTGIIFVQVMYTNEVSNRNNNYHVCDCIYLNNLLRQKFDLSEHDIEALTPDKLLAGKNKVLCLTANNLNHFFLIVNTTDFEKFASKDTLSTPNVQILNSILNITNVNNQTFILRFNDSALNNPATGEFYENINTTLFAEFKNLLTRTDYSYTFDYDETIIN